MSIFTNYVEEIQDAIRVFRFNEERGQKYISGLLHKFNFLRREADERLLNNLWPMYNEEVDDSLMPDKPILLPYLKGVINEIIKIACKEIIRIQEIKETSNIAEAMLQTFGEQYAEGGDIYELISEASSILLKAKAWHDRCSRATKEWRQLAYEYCWYVKRLPEACWPKELFLTVLFQ